MQHRFRANLARARQAAARWWQSRATTDSKSRPILISAIATCVITITGTWLTDRYQTQAWIRERQFEIFKQNFEGGLALVDDLAEHMGTRFVGLNRVIWAAERAEPDGIDAVWSEYDASVTGWNAKLLRYKSQLTRFIGPETAETFCSQDDYRINRAEGNPQSIHGLFLITQQDVRALVECVQRRCDDDERGAALRAASQSAELLGVVVEDFINTATTRVYERAKANRHQGGDGA
jgi:hypothetical protein